MESKVFHSQKYFVFKLADVLNNSYHIFEEKRMESLQFTLQLCMDTYEEMNSAPMSADKLEKSYKSLLVSLAFQLERHPFRMLDEYKADFDWICDLIEAQSKGEITYELFICLKSLKKRLQLEYLCYYYVSCLKRNMSYAQVDLLIEALISDWLYMGYSLYYLSEWYKNFRDNEFYEALENNDLNAHIEKLGKLNGEKKKYQVIIPFKVNSISQKEIAIQLLKKHFEIMKKDEFSPFLSDWQWKEELYACKEYSATDYYKAIGIGNKDFSTDKEIFAMWQNTSEAIRENVKIGCMAQGTFRKIDIRQADYAKLINYFDKNRAEQLNIFIELKDYMKNEDVDILERVLHTLHTAKGYNIQNRFLNFWSALEYTIYPFPRKSIIEKARILVSESFSLFYVKNKMNIFWERLSYTMERKSTIEQHPKCKEFMDICGGDKDFITIKVVQFLQNKDKYTELLKDISFHVVLERELQELIMLLTEPKKLKKALSEYHDSIVHDLDCIYRLRNQLIHSAKGMDDSLEHISLRLYRYVNSIVATILYYKRKNPEVSIIEILNSIHNTYVVYMKRVQQMENKNIMGSDVDGYGIVRPKYLFLE